ncbi:hypothetical protein PM082_024030 [Marasmius tenuissimus]|nr:hypothetical protein PM082_024030 [Marasmius tenuissimus]
MLPLHTVLLAMAPPFIPTSFSRVVASAGADRAPRDVLLRHAQDLVDNPNSDDRFPPSSIRPPPLRQMSLPEQTK